MDPVGPTGEPRRARNPRSTIVLGVILSVLGGCSVPPLAVLAALSANPCGAFGDACEEYGTTPASFVILMVLTVVAILLFLLGAVIALVGLSRRSANFG